MIYLPSVGKKLLSERIYTGYPLSFIAIHNIFLIYYFNSMSSYKSTVLIECTNIILLFRLPLNFGQVFFLKVWIDVLNEASHYLIKLTPTQHTYGKIIITTTIIYVFLYCSLFSIALFSLLLTFLYCFFFSCSLFSMVGYTWNQPYKGFNQFIKCIKSLIYLYFMVIMLYLYFFCIDE